MKRLIFSLLPLLLLSCSDGNAIVGKWQTSMTNGTSQDKFHSVIILTLTFERDGDFSIDSEIQMSINSETGSASIKTIGTWEMVDDMHIKAHLEKIIGPNGSESKAVPEKDYTITDISKDRLTLVSGGEKNEYRRVK